MTTTVVEAPVAAEETTGAKIEVPKSRTIGLTAEFRCRKDTRVDKGLNPTLVPCGAEAFVHVIYSTELDLESYICAHHATEQWDTIVKTAESVRDERSFINKTNASGTA